MTGILPSHLLLPPWDHPEEGVRRLAEEDGHVVEVTEVTTVAKGEDWCVEPAIGRGGGGVLAM